MKIPSLLFALLGLPITSTPAQGIVSINSTSAQDKYPTELLKKLHIKAIEGHIFETPQDTTPFLLTLEDFNPAGKRTKIQIFDSLGLGKTYEYIFERDTYYMERKTYFRDTLSSVTKVLRDEQDRIVGYQDFDAKGKKRPLHSTTKYNRLNQEIETKIFLDNTIIDRNKTNYYANGKIKTVLFSSPSKPYEKIRYDPSGNQIPSKRSPTFTRKEVIKNPKGYKGTMHRTQTQYKYTSTILAVIGFIKIHKNDILVTEKYLLDNGLPAFEVQYLNEVFVGKKVYTYLYFN
jgi:antitoxin component YwqK of YwqJK toxin-antitoxin module